MEQQQDMSNRAKKTLIVIGLFAAIAAVIFARHLSYSSDLEWLESDVDTDSNSPLPRLVDLGADKCIPCKMMAPMLEELKSEYAGRLKVEFIDVWKNPDEAKKYKIKIIPTQIFYDSNGRELFRHVGFFSKKDILAKWKQLGVELTETK
jgi:thioredoxin 1